MHRPSLKLFVRLDLAALALVLLNLPYVFLFRFPPSDHTGPTWTRAGHALLAFAPLLLGYTGDWRIRRRIQRGLVRGTWGAAEIEAAAALLSEPVRRTFYLAFAMLFAVSLALSMMANSSPADLVPFFLYSTFALRSIDSLRLRLQPVPGQPGPWTNFVPIHSAHWGQR